MRLKLSQSLSNAMESGSPEFYQPSLPGHVRAVFESGYLAEC